MRASAALLNKNLGPAETDLKKAIDLAPQSPVGYSRLAAVRRAQQRFSDSERLYEQALERDANFREALQGLVAVYQKQNQPGKALARVRSQVAVSPNNGDYYFLLGALEASGKNIGNAQAALEKAIALDKNNLDAFLLLGQLQAVGGSVGKAIEMGEKFIRDHPQDFRGFMLLGFLEESRGNWQRAQEMYEKALQASPEHPQASNNLAYLMLEHGGNVDVALTYAQTARGKMPDAANVADTLAWAYYHKGTYGFAAHLLDEALRKSPQNPTYHFHLGMVFQKQNNTLQAKEHLEKAIQINPKFPKADDARRALAQLRGE